MSNGPLSPLYCYSMGPLLDGFNCIDDDGYETDESLSTRKRRPVQIQRHRPPPMNFRVSSNDTEDTDGSLMTAIMSNLSPPTSPRNGMNGARANRKRSNLVHVQLMEDRMHHHQQQQQQQQQRQQENRSPAIAPTIPISPRKIKNLFMRRKPKPFGMPIRLPSNNYAGAEHAPPKHSRNLNVSRFVGPF